MVKHAVALVGLPGVGKTTIGQKLAYRLGVPFVDADRLIEERIGQKIRAYFETYGEDAFRNAEAQVLDYLLRTFNGVIATGGGAVLLPKNRVLLQTHALVIHLDSSVDTLYQRLRHDQQRPLLQVADPMERLHNLKAQRHALYQEVAYLTFQIDVLHADAVFTSMLAQIKEADDVGLLKMMPDNPSERRDVDGISFKTA